MRVVRNTGYIKARKRASRIMVALGMALMGGSWFFAVAQPDLFLFATVGLAFGFIFFNGGMQQVSRWSRRPRTDVLLDTVLQRLTDRYTLIHYPKLPGYRPDHVLVSPAGVIVITPREIGGRMSVNGSRWRRLGSPLGRMFSYGGPQLGNPTLESEKQVAAVKEVLDAENLGTAVEAAIVFVHDNVEVEMQESAVPVLHVTELYDHIRSEGTQVTLGTRERDLAIEKLSVGEQIERSTSTQAPIKKKKVRAA